MTAPAPARQRVVVLDTHIALDVCLFDDPRDLTLREQLQTHQTQWLTCDAMRQEFVRVLSYPKVIRAVSKFWSAEGVAGRTQQAVHKFDAWATPVAAAASAPVRCTDPDDQMFIDLACAHGAELISRDEAVCKAWRRCRRLGLGAPDWAAPLAAAP